LRSGRSHFIPFRRRLHVMPGKSRQPAHACLVFECRSGFQRQKTPSDAPIIAIDCDLISRFEEFQYFF
jgi:hypothetical protein